MFSSATTYQSKQKKPWRKTYDDLFFQPKLTINQPQDIYEEEAEAMADKVNKNKHSFLKLVNISSIQRKCAHCEKEEKLQMKGEKNAQSGMTAPALIHDVTNSRGQLLDAGIRGFMESHFGYDFGNVQVQIDSLANQSSAKNNALAYTHKNHVVFGAGQFRRETNAGKQLLAHELIHVNQQKENQSKSSIQLEPDRDPSKLSNEDLYAESTAIRDYVNSVAIDDPSYEAKWTYYNDVLNEVRKRCIKDLPSQPKGVSQQLVDRITGKYASVDKDPGEGFFLTPYIPSEGQTTIGYGRVVFPKSLCQITSEEVDSKIKKSCICQPHESKSDRITKIRYKIKSKRSTYKSKG